MYGFINKEDLAKWDKEDMQKAKNCTWMIDKNFKVPEKRFEKIKYVKDWYEKLCEYLPSPELANLQRRISKINIFWDFDKFSQIVNFARYDMVQKLLAYQYQKAAMIESYAEKPVLDSTNTRSTMEEYRINKLTEPLLYLSAAWLERKDKEVEGYTPTYDILLKLPPMEVIDYVGHRLIKYDQAYTYFAAMVSYPKELNKPIDIIYDKNPAIVEAKAENLFETAIENYIKDKANPYGDKSYKEVDISNIKAVMNGGTDPLSKDIF